MSTSLSNLSQPLKVWEKLEIIVGDDDKRGIYVARIEDFLGGGILITAPEFQQGTTLLRENCDVTVHVTKTDAVYEFASRIRRFNSQAHSLYLLTPPKKLRRVQRRQFVRIDYFEKIQIAVATPDYGGEEFEWHQFSTRNISGGGMLIRGPFELHEGDILLIRADIFKDLGIELPIAAICRRAQKEEKEHLAGIEFIRQDNVDVFLNQRRLALLPVSITEFDRAAQNQLVNHIFQQQIQMRRKGLL